MKNIIPILIGLLLFAACKKGDECTPYTSNTSPITMTRQFPNGSVYILLQGLNSQWHASSISFYINDSLTKSGVGIYDGYNATYSYQGNGYVYPAWGDSAIVYASYYTSHLNNDVGCGTLYYDTLHFHF